MSNDPSSSPSRSTTFRLRVWTRFLAPVAEVWRIKTEGPSLRGEFPAWLPFRVDDEAALERAFSACEPCEVRGSLGLGIPWPLRLEAVEPGVRYRDSSQNALYRRFEHEHIFEPTRDGCRYIDDVIFEPALPAAKALALSTLWLFQGRHRRAARLLPVDPQSVGTGVLRVLVEELED